MDGEPPTAMSALSELELLLVSNDYATLTAVSNGVKKHGGKFGLAPTTEAARVYIERRKIDGMFVDMGVEGALGLIESLRRGPANSKAAVFACVATAKESTPALSAGANFLLRKPLTADGIALHLTIAKDIMLREKRRYFRHTVNLPVTLMDGETEQNGRVVNLSEGGMAIRAGKPVKHMAGIDFAFVLGLGAEMKGKGLVAWTNADGMAGILFQTLHGTARAHLEAWLLAREQLSQDIQSGTASSGGMATS